MATRRPLVLNADTIEELSAGDEAFGEVLPSLCGGRLTLTSGTAVTTSDVTAAGTLYFTPFIHDKVALYDGTRWILYTFAEVSLSLTLTSGKNYDVFLYDNSGTLTLELSSAWTNDTTRANALTTQNGVRVKSGATTRRLVGTIRASAANQTSDSGGSSGTAGFRGVCNENNKVPRFIRCVPGYSDDNANTSYTTTSTTWTAANGGTGATATFLSDGKSAALFDCFSVCNGDATTHSVAVGIGIDSSTSPSVNGFWTGSVSNSPCCNLKTVLSEGGHTVSLCIVSKGGGTTCTYFADLARSGASADPIATAIFGTVMA